MRGKPVRMVVIDPFGDPGRFRQPSRLARVAQDPAVTRAKAQFAQFQRAPVAIYDRGPEAALSGVGKGRDGAVGQGGAQRLAAVPVRHVALRESEPVRVARQCQRIGDIDRQRVAGHRRRMNRLEGAAAAPIEIAAQGFLAHPAPAEPVRRQASQHSALADPRCFAPHGPCFHRDRVHPSPSIPRPARAGLHSTAGSSGIPLGGATREAQFGSAKRRYVAEAEALAAAPRHERAPQPVPATARASPARCTPRNSCSHPTSSRLWRSAWNVVLTDASAASARPFSLSRCSIIQTSRR